MKESDLKNLKTSELVAIYNKHNPGSTITKFSDRSTAIKRVLALNIAPAASEVAIARATKPPKVKKEKKPGVIATMKALCMRSTGASIDEIGNVLHETFPDKAKDSMIHTTRINLNPRLNKGYTLTKTKDETRGTVYRLKAN